MPADFSQAKQEVSRRYRFRVSRPMKDLLTGEGASRAVYRQFFPSVRELLNPDGYADDPLIEEGYPGVPGLLRKYDNKVLLLTTSECPVFCRFCTRKRKTLMAENRGPGNKNHEALLKYLNENKKINEVIFSGGDPFMLSAKQLSELVGEISAISHIQYLRFHTKTATALPNRLSHDFLLSLKRACGQKQATVVVHVNHPDELTTGARQAISSLQEHFSVFSQSVLLRSVNDSAGQLADLFKALFQWGVQPYYLHQLDKVTGASHFFVSEAQGVKLMQQVRKLVPPYMMPRYVKDSPAGKINLYY